MNKGFLIGLAAAAAAAYYLLTGKKAAIENLIVKPIDIAINSSKTSIYKLVFNLKLKITNESNFSVKVNAIDVDVIVNNNIIGEVQKNLPIVIAPNKTEIVIIELSVQNLAIIETVLNIITMGGKITAGVQGNVITDLGKVNFNYSANI
jgi:LEA14-like dessication related protein